MFVAVYTCLVLVEDRVGWGCVEDRIRYESVGIGICIVVCLYLFICGSTPSL